MTGTKWSKGGALPWTGEQVIPELMAGDVRELQAHVSRYVFALRWASEQETHPDVPPKKLALDAACGVGYGTAILSWVSRFAYGVDHDDNVVRYAERVYGTPRTRFLTEDVTKADTYFPAETFDTIVSFETVEHVEDPGGLIRAFHQVLKPGGYLVISAPHGSTSKFHVPRVDQPHGNYTRDELWNLLRQHFEEGDMEYWCQDERTNFYREEQTDCPIRTHIMVARKRSV